MPAVTSGTVAVTGANGFIGSHVIAKLLADGYSVRAVVRDAPPRPRGRGQRAVGATGPGLHHPGEDGVIRRNDPSCRDLAHFSAPSLPRSEAFAALGPRRYAAPALDDVLPRLAGRGPG